MIPMRKFRTIFAAGCVLALFLSAPAADAERAKWDQARVTKYAVELSDAMKDLKSAVQATPASENPANRASRFELIETLRLMRSSASHLAAELEAGNGYEETAATYRRLALLRRDAEMLGRRALIPAPTMDKIARTGGLLIRLAPYYDEDFEKERAGSSSE